MDLNSMYLDAADDLMTRAQKITGLFVKGDSGNYVINVYRILQLYEKLDREAAESREVSK